MSVQKTVQHHDQLLKSADHTYNRRDCILTFPAANFSVCHLNFFPSVFYWQMRHTPIYPKAGNGFSHWLLCPLNISARGRNHLLGKQVFDSSTLQWLAMKKQHMSKQAPRNVGIQLLLLQVYLTLTFKVYIKLKMMYIQHISAINAHFTIFQHIKHATSTEK